MSHDVSAEQEWVLVDGRHESVVNNEKCTMSLASFRNGLNIKYFESGVGWRLEPDHPCVGTEHLLELVDVTEVLESNIDVGVRSEDAAQVSLSATIDIIYAEDVIALLAEVHERNVGSHTRAGSKCEVGVFQRRKLSLQSESRWIAAPSVVKNNGLTWCWLSKSGRKVESGADTTELLTGLRSTMNDSRCDTPRI